jgi:hypothetical protein
MLTHKEERLMIAEDAMAGMLLLFSVLLILVLHCVTSNFPFARV